MNTKLKKKHIFSLYFAVFCSLNSLSFVSPQELYERCDKLRRAAFKMATEAEDNDTSLGLPDPLHSIKPFSLFEFLFSCCSLYPPPLSGDILQASDDLSRVINSYRKIVEGQVVNGDGDEPQSSAPSSGMLCLNHFFVVFLVQVS